MTRWKFYFYPGLLLVTIVSDCMTFGLEEDGAVANLRSYLRIPTAHPDPHKGYGQAIRWFKKQTEEIDLDFKVVNLGEGNYFAIIISWIGSDPELKSVLLNSHMDVVAVEPEKWKYPPFEAYKDENGNIYGRGANDMKSQTVSYLEAIRRLKESGFIPLRTIHVTILPDEEVGGFKGMKPFVESEHFKQLNVGIDIDEGGTNPGNIIRVKNAEKSIWQFNITARGIAAHGSSFPKYTAAQRMQYAINRIFKFRESEYRKLGRPGVTADQLTVVNLVQMGGGIGNNIIPNEVWASFDMRIRLRPGWNFITIHNMLSRIVSEASKLDSTNPNEVTLKYIAQSFDSEESIVDKSNIWWTLVQEACWEMNVTCEPAVLSGGTDGRYIRNLGISVFGLSPFLNTPSTAHRVNEVINEREYLAGIDRYQILIRKLTMLPKSKHA